MRSTNAKLTIDRGMIVRLLQMEMNFDEAINHASSIGVDLYQLFKDDLNILRFVFDLMGFPDDHDFPSDQPKSEIVLRLATPEEQATFSRDWLYQKWSDQEMSVDDYVDWLFDEKLALEKEIGK